VSTDVLELAMLRRLAAGFLRSPLQLNAHQESDAELVRLPGHHGVLALTTDGLAEEIETGLYDDPYRIGWMAVLVNASDLAAVGAEPIGILITETLPPSLSDEFMARLQTGIAEASAACRLPVLGGDTNLAPRLQLGGTAVGWIPDGRIVTRRGAAAGDRLYASGPLGSGSAFAFLQLRARAGAPAQVPPYQPQPRLREGQLVRRHASCAMDTSDGALATLDQLARINGVGFTVDAPEERWLHADATALAAATRLPAWMLLAGPHGEFELIFTVPAARESEFLVEAAAEGWAPVALGSATAAPEIRVPRGDELLTIDTGRVRNLFTVSGGDLDRYLEGLRHEDRQSAGSPFMQRACEP
jgi:thiamine-monophosphate kinase